MFSLHSPPFLFRFLLSKVAGLFSNITHGYVQRKGGLASSKEWTKGELKHLSSLVLHLAEFYKAKGGMWEAPISGLVTQNFWLLVEPLCPNR